MIFEVWACSLVITDGFPVEEWKGKKILFVMGGIGSAALLNSSQNDVPPSGTRRIRARQGRREQA